MYDIVGEMTKGNYFKWLIIVSLYHRLRYKPTATAQF